MSEDNTQTVVDETDAPAQQGAEEVDAREDGDDLEKLLSEFESSGNEVSADSKPEQSKDEIAALKSQFSEMQKQLAQQQFKDEIQPIIKKVRGDVPEDVFSDEEILDLLDGRAKRDKRLADAWSNRQSNPRAWDKVVDALGKELSGKFSKLPDPAATEDREAVTQAVRGASTKAPEDGPPPNLGSLSDGEAREAYRKAGLTPNF